MRLLSGFVLSLTLTSTLAKFPFQPQPQDRKSRNLRQATRHDIVNRAQHPHHRDTQPSPPVCTTGQTRASDGSCCNNANYSPSGSCCTADQTPYSGGCCATSSFSKATGQCCTGTDMAYSGGCCPTDRYAPYMSASCCAEGEEAQCTKCCKKQYATGSGTCCDPKDGRGTLTSDKVCCPDGFVGTDGKCTCSDVRDPGPTSKTYCNDCVLGRGGQLTSDGVCCPASSVIGNPGSTTCGCKDISSSTPLTCYDEQDACAGNGYFGTDKKCCPYGFVNADNSCKCQNIDKSTSPYTCNDDNIQECSTHGGTFVPGTTPSNDVCCPSGSVTSSGSCTCKTIDKSDTIYTCADSAVTCTSDQGTLTSNTCCPNDYADGSECKCNDIDDSTTPYTCRDAANCNTGKGVYTSTDKTCCPPESASGDACGCTNIDKTSEPYTCADQNPNGRRSAVPESHLRRRELGLAADIALTPKEVYHYLTNGGHFRREHDGLWVRDDEYLTGYRSSAPISFDPIGYLPDSWVAARAAKAFADPFRVYPLSPSHNMLVGDMPEILDMILEDPEFKGLNFGDVSLSRSRLEAIKGALPFEGLSKRNGTGSD